MHRTRWQVLRLWSIAAFVTLAPAGATAGEHAADVETFARIVAEVRTASERCLGFSVDWTAVGAEKERLHIADVDYFAFRQKALTSPTTSRQASATIAR